MKPVKRVLEESEQKESEQKENKVELEEIKRQEEEKDAGKESIALKFVKRALERQSSRMKSRESKVENKSSYDVSKRSVQSKRQVKDGVLEASKLKLS